MKKWILKQIEKLCDLYDEYIDDMFYCKHCGYNRYHKRVPETDSFWGTGFQCKTCGTHTKEKGKMV